MITQTDLDKLELGIGSVSREHEFCERFHVFLSQTFTELHWS